jgi:hypothetical protein
MIFYFDYLAVLMTESNSVDSLVYHSRLRSIRFDFILQGFLIEM